MDGLVAEGTLEFHPDHHRIGPAPDEIVLLYTISSGTLEGPNVHLSVVPNSGREWNSMRGDGVIALESSHVLCTPAEDLVYTTFAGIYDVGDDGYVDALDDALMSSARAEIAIRFYTAAKDYRWLNRVQFSGIGRRDFASRKLTIQILRIET